MVGFAICKAKLICFQWCLDLQTTLCLTENCRAFVKQTVFVFLSSGTEIGSITSPVVEGFDL